MIKVDGQGCIKATVVADSIARGQRITTFELEYPRFFHCELMTHRVFSRNAMSSRAVPIEKMIEQVRNNPATPVYWGINKAGMQAKEQHPRPEECLSKWEYAAIVASEQAEKLNKLGLHKQIVNRLLEPFQIMKTVVTSTEWDNFFYLRCHEDAQPEFRELATCMKEAADNSTPEELGYGEWHTPYVSHARAGGELLYTIQNGFFILTLEEAKKVSASCCAQVSYRLLDDSLEKAINIYNRLVESKPVHASPFEHQAAPMIRPQHHPLGWDAGTTHEDRLGNRWSGNFKGWIQHRQLIEGHVYE